ncbi:sigma factor-like helix-turn-helix DNA-binding protein [Streptomyces sp. NPDC020192]|uniref:sigma factor-like helix-turn-helix DNA-binding protein n=1 Tax=Streptomyces sp. NPDC020192 TaxID=3365066 RepID=UPI003797997E
MADSLSLAFLVLLESLSPRQRAAFLLREAFDYPYAEIAEILGTDVDGTRHLVARARNHLGKRRPRYHASQRQREELAQSFFATAQKGDLRALETLLAEDVALHGDGGGKVPALGRPVGGRERVARTVLRGFSAYAHHGIRIRLTEVNGQPGALAYDVQDRLVGVLGLGIAEGRIQTIHSINNPDKLHHLDQVSDLGIRARAGHRSGGMATPSSVGEGPILVQGR